MEVNLNAKQPKPTVGEYSNPVVAPQREYNIPKVGVLNPGYITRTPISDTIAIKKAENPHIKYRLPARKNNVALYNLASVGVILCGLLSLKGLKK